MTQTLKLALAQVNPVMGDLEGNASKILEFVSEAASRKSDLVIFPELAVTGYPPEDLLFKESFVTDQLRTLRVLASRISGVSAIVGFVDRDRQGLRYNAAAFIEAGRIQSVYHKICLPNYGVFDERRYFTPGKKPLVIRGQGFSLAVSICEDIWPRESEYLEALGGERLDLLVNLSASPFHGAKHKERRTLIRSLSKRLGAHVAYVNLVGGQDELVFDGTSLIANAQGRFAAEGPRFREALLCAELACLNRKSGRRLSSIHYAQSRLRLSPTLGTARHAAPPFRRLESEAEIYDALVLGLRDYAAKNGFRQVIIGLSGGIDSALVAAIACDALGPGSVKGVTLPSQFSSQATLRDAKTLAKNLGIECLQIPIQPLHALYLKALKPFFASRKPDITEENLQARIRGNLVMALSNKFGYLVLTTGNKSEIAMGYCTLYGDMAGGFAVIKDIPKTWVYRLSRYRNRLARRELIPLSIIKRPPTAELRHGQRDTDSLPPYDLLDPIVESYIENNRVPKSKRLSRTRVADIIRKIDASEYKRRQGPLGIKITPRAFGRDHRMPITNRYRGGKGR